MTYMEKLEVYRRMVRDLNILIDALIREEAKQTEQFMTEMQAAYGEYSFNAVNDNHKD